MPREVDDGVGKERVLADFNVRLYGARADAGLRGDVGQEVGDLRRAVVPVAAPGVLKSKAILVERIAILV